MVDPVPIAKNPGGRPRVGSTNIGLRLPPDELAALDKFRAKQGAITRQEAIRILLRDGLLDADAMPADPSLESRIKSPDELDAQNEG